MPGAFELPLAAKYCADSGRYAGVACLGAVIRGETDHYDFVCGEAAAGIARVSLDTGVPCAFGVLTVDNMDQALARDRRRQAPPGQRRCTGCGPDEPAARSSELSSAAFLPRGPGGASPDLFPVRCLAVPKVCYSCGKGPAFGQSRSHSMVATKRRFNPNLQKVRIDIKGTPSREYVCTRCLKAGKITKAA